MAVLVFEDLDLLDRAVVVLPLLRQGEHGLGTRVLDLDDQGVVVHLEHLRQLGVGRLATVLGRELLKRAVDAARLEAHEARHPVLRTQLVQDRAADAR